MPTLERTRGVERLLLMRLNDLTGTTKLINDEFQYGLTTKEVPLRG